MQHHATRNSGMAVLWLCGLGGAVLGLVAHFGAWHVIDVPPGPPVAVTGFGADQAPLGLGAVGVFTVLLLLRSPYTVLPALLFAAYVLEEAIGLRLLRFMPLESTRLTVQLYLLLPLAALMMILGGIGTALAEPAARRVR